MKHSANPVPYLYTQRGMCETCNPFMLKAFSDAPTRFYILSTYAANRPGRDQDIEIDGTYELDSNGTTMSLEYKPKYMPVVRIRDQNSAMLNQDIKSTDDENFNHAVNAEKTVLNELSKKKWSSDVRTFQDWVAEQRGTLQ